MDDSPRVGSYEPVRDAQGYIHGLAHRPLRTGRHRLAQRRCPKQFRDDEWHACIGANVVDGNDVRMVQRGDRASLAFETLATVAVGHPGGGQNLDRHVAAKTRIVSPVDLAHAAGAEHLRDLVRPESRPWVKGHRAAL
jgi:hypothetical protein